MIKVEANQDTVDVKEIRGTGTKIMAELCGIVRAVCTACCEDDENGAELTEFMITTVSNALIQVRPK